MDTNNASGSSLPSLVPSSSHSTATATAAANPATPGQASVITLAEVFSETGLSPPAKSQDVELTHIIDEANSVLSPTTWDNLSPLEKTRLGFLIFKNQIGRLRQRLPNDWVTSLNNAVLHQNTSEYKTLTSFIEKGGDKPGNEDSHRFRSLFLRKHPEWGGLNDKYFSLFAMDTPFNQRVEPFARFQVRESVVCWCICAFNAILYYMMLTTGTKGAEAIGQYGINVGRFMRNSFTDDEVFQTIFRNNGGYPDDLIDRLLSNALPTGGNNQGISFPVYLGEDMSAVAIWNVVSSHIKARGPLLVSNFRVFPSYLNTNTTVFEGDWNSLKGDNDPHHAFLITGVGFDDSTGKIIFEVQDSLPGRPFVKIGFDLLSSMGVQYTGIKQGAVFYGTSNEDGFDHVHIQASPTSGSPSIPEIAAAEHSFSDLSWNHSSSGDLGQSGNGTTDADTGSSRRNKPDWVGIDIPEGTDASSLVLYS